jgi:hypothetical protein
MNETTAEMRLAHGIPQYEPTEKIWSPLEWHMQLAERRRDAALAIHIFDFNDQTGTQRHALSDAEAVHNLIEDFDFTESDVVSRLSVRRGSKSERPTHHGCDDCATSARYHRDNRLPY